METVKKTSDYQVVKKRSGRFGVLDRKKNWIKGEQKVAILEKEGLVTLPKKAAPAPESAESEEETATEEEKTK